MKYGLVLAIILISGRLACAQEFIFSENGRMDFGFVQFDTILRYEEMSGSNQPFIFRRMDSTEHFPVPKRAIIRTRIDHLGTDSVERFCLVNTGRTPIRLRRQDLSLIAIKEAPNPEGNWKPIELWMFSTCGNSYMEYSILPGQALLMRTAKTTGSVKTKMRLRLKSESNGVILSEPFDAYFDVSCFFLNSRMESFSLFLQSKSSFLK